MGGGMYFSGNDVKISFNKRLKWVDTDNRDTQGPRRTKLKLTGETQEDLKEFYLPRVFDWRKWILKVGYI